MAVYLTFAAVAALILAYPYIRIFCKRISLAIRLGRFCRKRGVTMTTASPLWFLASNRRTAPVLFLETASHAWAVALFAVPKRASTLILNDNGTYQIETYLTLINVLTVVYRFHNRPRPLADVNFYTGAPDRVWIKHFTPVMLVNPGCLGMKANLHGRAVHLGNGDPFGGTVWCAFDRLRNIIEFALDREAGRVE